jgi:hypothetical protein
MVDTYQQPGASQPANIVDKVSETFSIVDYVPPAQLAAAKLGQVDIAPYAQQMFNQIANQGRGAAHFPAGKWSFGSAINIALPNNYDVIAIFGDGADISELTWTGANGGISITSGGSTIGYHFRDLSLTTGVANGGNAVSINQNGGAGNLTNFTNVVIRGADGYQANDYWSQGVVLDGVSNVNFDGIFISGPGSTAGNGIVVQGQGSGEYAIVINLLNSIINFCYSGFIYGSNVQGVYVTGTNFTGCINGIISVGGDTGQDELIVLGCQFGLLAGNGSAVAIPTNVIHVDISHNLIFFHALGLNISRGSFVSIQSNLFTGFDPQGTAIIVADALPTTGIIDHNTFYQTNVGIILNQGSSGFTVGMSNKFQGVNTPVVDSSNGGNQVFTPPNHSGKIWGDGDTQFIKSVAGWAIKYPNGFVRQGGRVAGGQGDINITYPLPFSTVFSVSAKIIGRSPGQIYDVGIDNISATGFSAGPRYYGGGTSVGVATQPYFWTADGFVSP